MPSRWNRILAMFVVLLAALVLDALHIINHTMCVAFCATLAAGITVAIIKRRTG